MATTQEGVQISAIVPTLTVDDLQKSISFYEAPDALSHPLSSRLMWFH